MAIINDRVPNVQAILGGRTDIVASIPGWIQSALLELTESNPFEELRETGPQVALSIPAAGAFGVYPVINFLNPNIVNVTQVVTFSLFVDYPNNTVAMPLAYRSPQVLDAVGTLQSIPTQWSRVGSNLFIGPPPNLNFTCFMRYQKEHPFLSANIGESPIYVPNSWLEIVDYSAALRAATQLRSDDYISRFHDILFGDPEYRASGGLRGRPGLIAARTFQNQRDSSNNTRRLGIQVARYSSRRR